MILLQDVIDTKQHLMLMMSQERSSGDYYLAAVVQDSLTFSLYHHAHSRDLAEIARTVSQVSIQSAAETMGDSEFVVSESVRGVMHSMVGLGGDALEMAMSVAMGGMMGVERVFEGDLDPRFRAIINGISAALSDLGVTKAS